MCVINDGVVENGGKSLHINNDGADDDPILKQHLRIWLNI